MKYNHTCQFDTESQALAFQDGILYLNDRCRVAVNVVCIKPLRNRWIVYLWDDDSMSPPGDVEF